MSGNERVSYGRMVSEVFKAMIKTLEEYREKTITTEQLINIYIRASRPNNWLKMHGYAKRRKMR